MSNSTAATSLFYLFVVACLSGIAALAVVWFQRRAGVVLACASAALFAAAWLVGRLANI